MITRRVLTGSVMLAVATIGLPAVPSRAAAPSGAATIAAAAGAGPAAAVVAAARPVDDPIDRVLAVSVDGLNPRAITSLGPAARLRSTG
jgi:hypothetical protein